MECLSFLARSKENTNQSGCCLLLFADLKWWKIAFFFAIVAVDVLGAICKGTHGQTHVCGPKWFARLLPYALLEVCNFGQLDNMVLGICALVAAKILFML